MAARTRLHFLGIARLCLVVDDQRHERLVVSGAEFLREFVRDLLLLAVSEAFLALAFRLSGILPL
jgi:hypothetical protein